VHAYRLAPRGLKSWPIGLAALTVAEVALITGLTPRLDLKNGYFGTPILGVMIACLICAGLLSCTNAVAARTGKLGHGLSSVVSVYGSAVILAHGVPVYALHGRAAAGLVLVGVVFGTFVLVGAAALTPWRSALLGLRRAPRPEAELSA
jgi:hypothetical protein